LGVSIRVRDNGSVLQFGVSVMIFGVSIAALRSGISFRVRGY